MEGAELAVKIFSIWLTLVLGFILLPSAFGVSLGISEIYMKILVKTLEWATLRIEKSVPEESFIKNSASVGIQLARDLQMRVHWMQQQAITPTKISKMKIRNTSFSPVRLGS